MESDIRIRLWAARVVGIGFVCKHLHEVPLDAVVIGGKIHTVDGNVVR